MRPWFLQRLLAGRWRTWPLWLAICFLCLALPGMRGAEPPSAPPKGRKVSQQKLIVGNLLKTYDKQDTPLPKNVTTVMLGMSVNSSYAISESVGWTTCFYAISESTMDYMVSFDLHQKWTDPRLAYSAPTPRLREIKLGDMMWAQIWVPDTFFRNEKKANFHDISVNNRRLRLTENGTVTYVSKISATFSCPMKLQSYPLDTQRCPITFESFGYTRDTMIYVWLDEEKVVDLGSYRQLPQFTLVGYTRHQCGDNEDKSPDVYACLEVHFVLRRDIGFYLIQVYVPSILIVILSWVSFWINVDASPARVSIGLLTVLTTTTMSAGARASLPRVSYIKAIDIWMIICLIFVFASLIEYAVVNVISRRKPQKPLAPRQALQASASKARGLCRCVGSGPALPGGPPQGGLSGMEAGGVVGAAKPPETDWKKKARNIDKFSRQCFPTAFILFNVIYWTAYVIPTHTSEDNIET